MMLIPDVSEMLQNVALPNMIQVKQKFPHPRIPVHEIPEIIKDKLAPFTKTIRPGMRVAVTAGSRGIRNISLILRCIVNFVYDQGGNPFIVPAMGSHGGATAEGQLSMLHSLGITEETVGCPICSSTDVVQIGTTDDGQPVMIDKYAAESDGIIVAGRIKPHTGFRGKYESGIMKMMAIGLGKPAGASFCHGLGISRLAESVERFGTAVLHLAPILFAVAILENAYDETCEIVAIDKEEIPGREPALLKKAFSYMPRIWVDECDILVVDQIGKNFSGDGMDPNITGTFCTNLARGGIKSKMVTILGLSEETHGNAVGIGSADAVPQSILSHLDLQPMYMNAITSTVLATVRIPMLMANHKECIQVCLRCCDGIDKENPKIVRISNSLDIEYIQLSEAYYGEICESPNLEPEGAPKPWNFDSLGNLF